MTASIPTFRLTRKNMMLIAVIAMLAAFIMSASPAGAFHCYVADKPAGAGAVTEDDLKVAGKSGKLVAPGAFLDLSESGLPDVFIRGKPVADVEPPIVGIGSLPDPPHYVGSDTHGIQEINDDD